MGLQSNDDPRNRAAYTVAEAARYVRIPPQTLRAWVVGQSYTEYSGRPPFRALITPPEERPLCLSFHNLVEAYTLRALRTTHNVSIAKAREALDFAEVTYRIDRLLLRPELRTSAGELFLKKYGELVNLNRSGQIAMKHMLKEHLNRIELDSVHIPTRFYLSVSRTIVIDHKIAFGRPIVSRRAISTAAIVDRLNAHESVQAIARDYGLTPDEVGEATVYEYEQAA